jgi:hypothetical protein
MSAWRKRQIAERQAKMDKEEFMVQWVLTRASFREDFSGTAAARAAHDVWVEIQRLKDKHE